MNAKYLLLNHFSQRYPKHPQIAHFADRAGVDTKPASGPIIAMAYDLMILPLKDFPKMEAYMPALEALFEEVAKEEGSEHEGEAGEATPTKASKDKKKGQGKAVDTQNGGTTSRRAEKKAARASGGMSKSDAGGKMTAGKRPSEDGDQGPSQVETGNSKKAKVA